MLPRQLAPAATPPGERAWTEPSADLARPSPGACGPTGQASDPQPSPHDGGIGELSPRGGPSQRGQHCQATCERGSHRPGLQLQQAQAQAHQRQHRHAGATRRRDAAPTRCVIGSPSGGAHGAGDQARPVPDPLPCLTLPGPGVVAVGWAKTRPGGLAETECRAGPARSARAPLPPPAAVHPATRTATAPSSAPACRDRARKCETVIAPSRHGSGGIPLTHLGRNRFPPGVRNRPASLAWCWGRRNRGPRTGPGGAKRRTGGRRARLHGGAGTHNLLCAYLAIAVIAGSSLHRLRVSDLGVYALKRAPWPVCWFAVVA